MTERRELFEVTKALLLELNSRFGFCKNKMQFHANLWGHDRVCLKVPGKSAENTYVICVVGVDEVKTNDEAFSFNDPDFDLVRTAIDEMKKNLKFVSVYHHNEKLMADEVLEYLEKA